jgi:hypothetical protein
MRDRQRQQIEVFDSEFSNYLDSKPGLAQFQMQEIDGTALLAKVNGAYDPAYNGTASNTTPGTIATGNLGLAHTFAIASNSYGDIYSAALAAFFDGSQGTLGAFCKINNAAIWSDGNLNIIVRIGSAAEFAALYLPANVDSLLLVYRAGGIGKSVTTNILGGTTDWFNVAITWDKAADEVRPYINGTQVGPTLTGLGVYGGGLTATQTTVGADSITPTLEIDADINYVYLANRAFPPPEMAEIWQHSGLS